MKKMNISDIFSVTHTLEILFICEEGKNVTEISRELGLNSTTSVYTALKRLKEYKLIESELITQKGLRNVVDLTEKGKEVLKLLKQINLTLSK